MIVDANLWNSLPVPALLLAADDTIAEINPAAELFLNLSSKALAGALLWDKVMIDAPLESAFARARTQRSSLFVNDVDVGSGERAPMQCNIQFAPLQGTEGLMLMMISPREIASRMTQNASSAKAAKSAIGMAEMLAHEIKNPLAGITGAAQLLSMGLEGEDIELTDLIVEESRRIVKLLEQVEQFGNLRPPTLKAVNIHDVLDRARQSAAVGFGAHMMFVEDYDPSLPQTWADADQLLQVFLNLLKNASEAGRAGGSIRLRTFYEPSLRVRRPDGTQARLPLQIEVVDDGPGLPPDIAADVFEPFVSGRENGTGLGLALVSKLIADVGGWISVDSVPGRTAFRISLPLAPKGAPEEAGPEAARAESHPDRAPGAREARTRRKPGEGAPRTAAAPSLRGNGLRDAGGNGPTIARPESGDDRPSGARDDRPSGARGDRPSGAHVDRPFGASGGDKTIDGKQIPS